MGQSSWDRVHGTEFMGQSSWDRVHGTDCMVNNTLRFGEFKTPCEFSNS